MSLNMADTRQIWLLVCKKSLTEAVDVLSIKELAQRLQQYQEKVLGRALAHLCTYFRHYWTKNQLTTYLDVKPRALSRPISICANVFCVAFNTTQS